MKTVHTRYLAINSHAQQGTAALLISLVILTLITFVSLYTSKTVIVEQQISGNEYRSRVAFEAAEAGMAAALTYVEVDPDRDNDGDLTDELIFDAAALPADRRVQMSGVGTNNDKAFTNNSTVIVGMDGEFSDTGTVTQVDITALGISGDGSATRTISKTVQLVDPLPNFPAQPYTARGTVTVSGSATVSNPEGRTTVLTGSDFDMGSSMGSDTWIADKNHVNDPACLGGSSQCSDAAFSSKTGCPSTVVVKCAVVESSNAAISGIDIIEHDGNLANLSADDFFFNFFGLSKAAFKKHMEPRIVAGGDVGNAHDAATNPGVKDAYGELIWVEGAADIGGEIMGCEGGAPNGKNDAFDESCSDGGGTLDPVIIIVNGDVTFSGNPQIFGLMYVTGDILGHGNPEIQGAFVQESKTSIVSASLNIWYDSRILEMTQQNGPLGGASGSWKDF